MLFNSLEFLIFFVSFFAAYWLLKKHLKYQNILLLLGSYLFYAWWDWRFLGLIILSTFVDYWVGLQMADSRRQKKRKILLYISVGFNLGMLMYFKYFNFFVDSFIDSVGTLGYQLPKFTTNIILPVGISFYTFQTMSYTIDIFKKQISPTKDWISFAAFVAFFPQLVAGPIERASNLLPQILKTRHFDYKKGKLGLRLILWGLFKKVAVADVLAKSANEIFGNYSTDSGLTLALGVIFFAIQIYCDFSGYSDIAIGTAKLLGIDLMENFRFPYFSKNISDFWRRWHISLSTWFRDYLYIPLGGSRKGNYRSILNVMIIFVVSGFWHGAAWTFVIWGFLHGLFFIPGFIWRKRFKKPENNNVRFYSPFLDSLKILWTFIIVCFAWIFFRAESLDHALNYISSFSLSYDLSYISPLKTLVLFFILELIFFKYFYSSNWSADSKKTPLRWAFYSILLISLFSATTETGSDFIYFQF